MEIKTQTISIRRSCEAPSKWDREDHGNWGRRENMVTCWGRPASNFKAHVVLMTPTRTLWLLRHAKSAWDDPTMADHERPLNGRGRLAAPRIAQVLAMQQPLPQLVLCSTAVRTRATWDHIAASIPVIPVEYRAELYHANTSILRLHAQRLPESIRSVLLIGHNPGLEEWLTELTGFDEPLPTAALAQVTVPLMSWSELTDTTSCRLEKIWRPRELPDPLQS